MFTLLFDDFDSASHFFCFWWATLNNVQKMQISNAFLSHSPSLLRVKQSNRYWSVWNVISLIFGLCLCVVWWCWRMHVVCRLFWLSIWIFPRAISRGNSIFSRYYSDKIIPQLPIASSIKLIHSKFELHELNCLCLREKKLEFAWFMSDVRT